MSFKISIYFMIIFLLLCQPSPSVNVWHRNMRSAWDDITRQSSVVEIPNVGQIFGFDVGSFEIGCLMLCVIIDLVLEILVIFNLLKVKNTPDKKENWDDDLMVIPENWDLELMHIPDNLQIVHFEVENRVATGSASSLAPRIIIPNLTNRFPPKQNHVYRENWDLDLLHVPDNWDLELLEVPENWDMELLEVPENWDLELLHVPDNWELHLLEVPENWELDLIEL